MAILANQRILTLDYWKFARDLKIGDIVFDRNGQPCKIINLHQYVQPETFRVCFNDLLEIEGDQHLAFLVETTKYRKQLDLYKNTRPFLQKLKLMKVGELESATERLSIPTTDSINLPHQDLPVPPFLFGFWFFNRRSNKTMAAPKQYTEKVHAMFIDHGYKIREHTLLPKGSRTFSVTPKIESQMAGTPTHRIPINYLMASKEQRIDLLRGIMHSREWQYNKEKNFFKFTTIHQALALQIQGLLESLGHRISVSYNEYKKYYYIRFRSKLPLVEGQPVPKNQLHNGRRYINKVKTLPAHTCVHIETDGKDKSILVGEGFIPCL